MKIKRLLEDYQEFHSDFQIEHFIIGSQGDDWAKYKQCLREIRARVESIESDEAQLLLLCSESNGKCFFLPTRKNRKKRMLAEQANKKQIESLKKVIGERKRELKKFVEIASRLKAVIGKVSAERRRQLESASWTDKGRRMLAIDRLIYGGLQQKTIEYIFSLPRESITELMLCIQDNKNQKELIEEATK